MILVRGTIREDMALYASRRAIRLGEQLPSEIALFRGLSTFGFPLCEAALVALSESTIVAPYQVWEVPAEDVRLADLLSVRSPKAYAESWRVGKEGFEFPFDWGYRCPQDCGDPECIHGLPYPVYPKGCWEAMWLTERSRLDVIDKIELELPLDWEPRARLLLELDHLPDSVGEIKKLVRR